MCGDNEPLHSENQQDTKGTTPPRHAHFSRKIIPTLVCFQPGSIHHFGGVTATLLNFLRGMIYGLIALSFLLFLDHCNIIHMESAHVLRSSVLKSLSIIEDDSKGLSSLEASSGLKFIAVDQYVFWMYELDDAPKKIQIVEEELEQLKKNQMAMEEESVPLAEEFAKLMANPLVKLDHFCDECSWHRGTSCASRVEYLMNTYRDSKVKAQVALMENTPSCDRQNGETSVTVIGRRETGRHLA
mmetsp:Transcript_16654/g.33732  ORF Transcript_16654/g.33732 Transcript_16654/m.33732 type:complete len:242 (-) Transcript_16654:109-834(-)